MEEREGEDFLENEETGRDGYLGRAGLKQWGELGGSIPLLG